MWRVAFLVFFAGPVWSDPGPLAAVGKLVVDGNRACSGTLIAPDLVLTAGHCVMRGRARGIVSADLVTFQPSRTPGIPQTTPSSVGAIAVHPVWSDKVGPEGARLAFDLALLRLKAPVSDDAARPLTVGLRAELGDAVIVAGYPRGRGALPRQRRCRVIETSYSVIALGCPVEEGESGAPILRLEAGKREVAGVLSSKGELGGQPVGIGTVPKNALDTLLEHLRKIEASENAE